MPLTGGPNGYFSHELREDTRQREYGQALKRRPGLEGIEHIDRRAVYKVLDPRAPRNKKITPRQRGCMQAVVSWGGHAPATPRGGRTSGIPDLPLLRFWRGRNGGARLLAVPGLGTYTKEMVGSGPG